ncbi:MAG: hypothetical protein HOP18_03470 [Deltaproteobacteria bacterium]|nr:hypothetical protein [Deltaproteobacteria bacterium]
MLDEQSFLVLNALHLKKMTSAENLAEIAALPVDQVRTVVSAAEQQEWLLNMEGELILQEEGVAQVLGYYREAYFALSQREEFSRWHDRFEPINSQFIKFVTEWQQTEGDAEVQERVIGTVEKLMKLIGEISRLVPRYASYIRRFERGVTKVDEGNNDFVCNPMVESLHNIWFEFHEDFLAVLGRPRDS